jgi:protein PhnA
MASKINKYLNTENVSNDNNSEIQVHDSNGNLLQEGDSVHLTQDLKVKGSSLNLKRGTKINKIRLIDDAHNIECRIGKSTIVLKTQFLKKV